MSLDLAVLAAWLHDIGKFAQRAGAPASRGMEQEYCPGGSSHRHVFHTDYFVEHVLPLPEELEAARGTLARLASAHHRADAGSREESAIQKADQLSSGLDRTSGDAEGDDISARLESVFSRVRLGGRGLAKDSSIPRYRLLPLDADNAPFPVENAASGTGYAALYRNFCEDLRTLPLNMGTRAYMSSLVSLLERYTWCIPSSTYDTMADISLFDHSSTSAAIIQALLSCPPGEEKFLLYGADLSGIQDFIFGREETADKGASKLLRARSFLLQAVTRSVWLVFLERLGLAPAAKIMDAGGRFVLLLPDTVTTRQTLDNLENEVDEWLLREFQGAVRLTFARLPLAPDDLKRENFTDSFEAFNDALENAKLRPFDRIFRQGRSAVFPVNHENYSRFGECGYCHSRPATGAEEDLASCGQCANLVRLGAKLPLADYLVFSRHKARAGTCLFDGVGLLFGGLGLRLHDREPDAGEVENALDVVSMKAGRRFSVTPVAGQIPLIREADLDRWRQEERIQTMDGQDFFDGQACAAGEPKTFAMLAGEALVPPAGKGQGCRSIPCLAVCKADVDNLGLVFGLGFGSGGQSAFTISRFAMLARMLNFFFSSCLMRMVKKDFPDIYVIFAGGDDLFVLGPWDKIIRFASRLHNEFQAFCGHNPAMTLSAGLPLVRPGLPMRAIREEAEGCLDKSKRSKEKNAATLFGVTASWPEFDKLLEEGLWLEDLCLNGKISQGLLRRMLLYSRDCLEFSKGDMRGGLYLSHLAYDLARNCKDLDENNLNRIRSMGQDKNHFGRAQLGISWALYRTRGFLHFSR